MALRLITANLAGSSKKIIPMATLATFFAFALGRLSMLENFFPVFLVRKNCVALRLRTTDLAGSSQQIIPMATLAKFFAFALGRFSMLENFFPVFFVGIEVVALRAGNPGMPSLEIGPVTLRSTALLPAFQNFCAVAGNIDPPFRVRKNGVALRLITADLAGSSQQIIPVATLTKFFAIPLGCLSMLENLFPVFFVGENRVAFCADNFGKPSGQITPMTLGGTTLFSIFQDMIAMVFFIDPLFGVGKQGVAGKTGLGWMTLKADVPPIIHDPDAVGIGEFPVGEMGKNFLNGNSGVHSSGIATGTPRFRISPNRLSFSAGYCEKHQKTAGISKGPAHATIRYNIIRILHMTEITGFCRRFFA